MSPIQNFYPNSELLDVYFDLLEGFEGVYGFNIFDFWKVGMRVEWPGLELKPRKVSLI